MAAWADVNLAGLVGPSLKKGKENNYEPYGVELYQRVCERERERDSLGGELDILKIDS